MMVDAVLGYLVRTKEFYFDFGSGSVRCRLLCRCPDLSLFKAISASGAVFYLPGDTVVQVDKPVDYDDLMQPHLF